MNLPALRSALYSSRLGAPLFGGALLLYSAALNAQGQAHPPAPQAATADAHAAGRAPSDDAHLPHLGEAPRVPDMGLRASPFASMQHRQWADQARAGRIRYPGMANDAVPGIPAGTIGVLVYDTAQGIPLVNLPVKLKVVHQSIAEGDNTQYLDTVTDDQGRGGFLGQPTDSAFHFELEIEYQDVKYTSGSFSLKRDAGQVVAFNTYPSTRDLNQTFVFSRALYVVVPRDDVFECQGIFRFHNASPTAWVVNNVELAMPKGTKAFRTNAEHGDLEARFEKGHVILSGAVPPGQAEVSFTFHVPNPRLSDVHFDLATSPNLIDGRVYAEVSPSTSLSVSGFEAPEATKGKEGQRALLANKDFLMASSGPTSLSVHLTGLPTRGYGSWVAAFIAAGIAGLGASFAFTSRRAGATVNAGDRQRARELLLDELVALEQARGRDQIGPKTYEQARRTLLDALARLDVSA